MTIEGLCDSDWEDIIRHSRYTQLSPSDQKVVAAVIEQLKGCSDHCFESCEKLFKWDLRILKTLASADGVNVYLSNSDIHEVLQGRGKTPEGFHELAMQEGQREALNRMLDGVTTDILVADACQEVRDMLLTEDGGYPAENFRERIIREYGSYCFVSRIVDAVLERNGIVPSHILQKGEREPLEAQIQTEVEHEMSARLLVQDHWEAIEESIQLDELIDRESIIVLNHYGIAWDYDGLEDKLVDHLVRGHCSFFDPSQTEHPVSSIAGHFKYLGKPCILEDVLRTHPSTSWMYPDIESVQRAICLAESIWSGVCTKLHAHLLENISQIEFLILERAHADIVEGISTIFNQSDSEIPEVILRERVADMAEAIFFNIARDVITDDRDLLSRLEQTLRREKEDILVLHTRVSQEYDDFFEVLQG